MYERILVPIDGGDCSEHAAEHARDLARALGSSVTLLFVRDTPSLLRDGVVDVGPLLEDAHREGQLALERVALTFGAGAPRSEIVDGDPAAVIVEASRRFDLVVMGCHARGLLQRMVLGSVTASVLHRIACPLLIVHSPRPTEHA